MSGLLLAVLAYVGVQFAIGIAVSRRIRSESDYLVAGRRLGLVLASFSIFATWFGAETVVGAAGAVYENGLSGGSADPFGYVTAVLLMGLIFAIPLWRRRYTTLCDLFRERYSSGVEWLAVLLVVPPSVIWAAAQIRAFGHVVSSASDIEVNVAVTFAAVVVIAYTAVGGLLADAWTDLIQGGALILGLGVLAVALLGDAEFRGALEAVPMERLSPFGDAATPWYVVVEDWAVPICGSVIAIELVTRILACKTGGTARNACFLGGGLYLAIGLIPVLVGLAGPQLMPDLDEPEQIIPLLVGERLGAVIYVLFAGALISAILSSVDSALLAASALLSHNVVVRLFPEMDERSKVRAARLGVAGLGVAAYLVALGAESIYETVETASAFGSAGVFVIGCFGLFSRRGGAASAYAALVTGMAVWGWGEYVGEWPAPYATAVVAALGAYVGAAAVTAFVRVPAPPPEPS